MGARVVAVCVVHRVKDGPKAVGRTAIDKRPVAGPVPVGPLGLAGDTQCDTENHGGVDAALYAYAREEADRWAAELGRDIPPGGFGENLAVTGLRVTDAVVGTRWRIGDTVEVAVTAPRIPCSTFSMHMDEPHWVKRFSDRGDVGAYLRVVVPGAISAGEPVEVLSVPAHGLTVRELFGAWLGRVEDAARLRHALTDGDGLTDTVRAVLRARLQQVVGTA